MKNNIRMFSLLVCIALMLCNLFILPVGAAESTAITSGDIYRFKNVNSSKYLNVHYGYDVNLTNVYQYTGDDSVEQTFRVVYDSDLDAYRIYAMCSSNGRNRVLDIYQSGLTSGNNLQIYNKNNATSDQTFKIVSLGNDKYKIVMAQSTTLALTAYGTSNGSATGKTSTSTGNVYISTYTGSAAQQWYIESVDNNEDYYNDLGWKYMFHGNSAPKYISSDYGYRTSPTSGSYQFHSGIDIPATLNTSIYSVADGKVVYKINEPSTTSGRGYGIIVEHSSKVYNSETKLRTLYQHLSSDSTLTTNTSVTSSTIVGYAGSTGASTGVHLHFTVISNGGTSSSKADQTLEPMFFFMDEDFTYDTY